MVSSTARTWLRQAELTPEALPDEAYAALLQADGADLDDLTRVADDLRRSVTGEVLTFVANRNLDTLQVGGPDSLALVDDLAAEAWSLGATEICIQGPLPPGAPDDGYLTLVRTIMARSPELHLHAFRPAEVADGARRLGLTPRQFLESALDAGVGTVPGTAARILDDEVRAVLNGGPDMPVSQWIELITTAHDVGLRSTATMMYGSVESPAQQVTHLRTLAGIQDRTGGFTEFIPMPWTPVRPTDFRTPATRRADLARESRAVHAVARLMLHGRIDHVQAAWTKLGPELTEQVLRGGADDLGGLLMDGRIRPDAGQEAGRELRLSDVTALAERLGRTVRQRTTTYGEPDPERRAVLAQTLSST